METIRRAIHRRHKTTRVLFVAATLAHRVKRVQALVFQLTKPESGFRARSRNRRSGPIGELPH
ncbi:hypothetical protein [Piscinibacter sakaiensis]|uniref:hypothetical protein n=1 Tax=Piscinibacter sakaiensis TaxID=1547922 RepID=UPI003AABCF4C